MTREFRLEQGSFPLDPASSIGDILTAVEGVLRLGRVQRVTVEIDRPITYSRLVKRGEGPGDAPLFNTTSDIFSVLRNLPTDSFIEVGYEGFGDDPPEKVLVHAFSAVESRGYWATHLVTGPGTRLFRWMGWDTHPTFREPTRFLGARIVKTDRVPDNVVVVCGSDEPEAAFPDIRFGCKVAMLEETP